MRAFLVAAGLVFALTGAGALTAQQVNKEQVAGIRNLARIETTVACAGATSADAVPAIKQMGFVSIVNLREATEPGAEVEAEGAAAKAAGLQYFHVPFNGQKQDPAAAKAFIDAITSPGAEPAFIHCGGGNRAATMWLIKRLAVDHWPVERAIEEATALGLSNQANRQWAIEMGERYKR